MSHSDPAIHSPEKRLEEIGRKIQMRLNPPILKETFSNLSPRDYLRQRTKCTLSKISNVNCSETKEEHTEKI